MAHKSTELTSSAGVTSIAIFGSRIMGLVREQVLAALFKSSTSLSAFYAAFFVPNLLRDLFGEGILSKAFVTTFMQVEADEGEEASWRLANLTFNALFVVLGLLTLLGILIAPLIVDLVFHGKGFQDFPLPAEEGYSFTTKTDLTVHLTRIMFPFILVVSLAAIAMGLLNSKGRFFVPASASTFFNVGSVLVGVAGYYLAPRWGQPRVVGMAVGVLVGGLLQVLVQVPSLYQVGFRYRPILDFRDPALRQILRLVAPMVVGAAAVQLNVLINKSFASYGDSWVAWLVQAFRLIHLPIGVFGVAISTVTLPILSRATAHANMAEYRQAIAHAFRLMLLLTVPASVGLIVLREPIIRLIFERGAFTPADTHQVANALLYYAIGLCSFSGVKIATDGFYALKNTRTPVLISFVAVSLNLILNYLFIVHLHWDHRSLALSTSCSLTLNLCLLVWLLRRQVGGLGGKSVLNTLVRVLVASGCMAVVAWWCSHQLASLPRAVGIIGEMIQVGGSIGVAAGAYLIVCYALRIEELQEFIDLIRRGLGR